MGSQAQKTTLTSVGLRPRRKATRFSQLIVEFGLCEKARRRYDISEQTAASHFKMTSFSTFSIPASAKENNLNSFHWDLWHEGVGGKSAEIIEFIPPYSGG